MPHQCTNCGHTFPDGSKEMLSGCPDCGGNKFQFRPAGSNADSVADDAPASKADASTGDSVTIDPETPSAGRQTSPPETEGVDESEVAQTEGGESPAQSTARSDVVSSSELTAAGSMGPQSTTEESTAEAQPPADQPATTDGPASDAEPPAETADGSSEESNLDELRKELNNQFESIRIVSPGQYELNLMELYDRDEYIISLREDGRYVIEVPDGWGDS